MCESKRDCDPRPGVAAGRNARRLLALLFVAVALTGCVPYALRAILDGPTGKPLSLSPQTTIVPANGSVQFAAEGGVPPYVYSIVSGGGTLGSTTGVYTAPMVPGSAEIWVTDSTGKSAKASATIQAFASGLAVAPGALSLMVGGSVTFTAIGGTPPYSFSILTAGSGSPSIGPATGYYVAGLTTGTDTIRVVDGAAAAVTATVTVTALASNVDYVISSTSFPTAGTTSSPIPGGASFTVKNSGTAPGNVPVDWKVFLSSNNVIDGGDMMVASGTTAAGLLNGASQSVNFSGTFPAVAAGPWYLIAQVSAADDTTPVNNTSLAGAITLSPPDVNYTVSGVSKSGTSGIIAGAPMDGTLDVSSTGTAGGSKGVDWTVYASLDNILDPGDFLIARGNRGALGAAPASASIPFSGYWPSTPNTWYLIATARAADDILPGDDTGISVSTITTVAGSPPATGDYTVSPVTLTSGVVAGDPLSGSFTITNGGPASGALPVYWTAYLSSDSILQIGTDPVIDSGWIAALGASVTSTPVSFAGTWPSAAQTWHLIVAISASDDTVPGNNVTIYGPLSTTLPVIDYKVESLSSTGGTTAGGALSGSLVIRNVGTHTGTQFVPWAVYLSADSSLSPGTDLLLATGSLNAPGLAAGATNLPLNPINFAGTWPASNSTRTCYFIATVGAGDDVNPVNDAGNSAIITVNPPDIDYAVTAVLNTGGTTAGGPLSGSFILTNVGATGGSAPVTLSAFLSSDPFLDASDLLIQTGPVTALPGGGTTGVLPFNGTWPAGASTRHLIVWADAADDANASNNWQPSAPVAVTVVKPIYAITNVALPAGNLTGQPVSGSITIQNQGTAAGITDVSWQVYASLGDAVYNAGDTMLATGTITGGLPISGSSSPGWSGTWPATPGTYCLVVRASAAGSPAVPDAASGGTGVTDPPAPDYTLTFDPAIPWTGVAGAAMSLTGTCKFTISNVSANAGHQTLAWAVYLSTDDVLDAGDQLLQQQSGVAPLAGGGTLPVTFNGTWPAVGKYTLIATVQAADDGNATNNVVVALHPSYTGNYRYLEVEPNNGVGPNPPIGQTDDTLVTALAANQTIVIEGSMDAAGSYDTYRFTTTASVLNLSLRILWKTGYDDLDLYLWDTFATNLSSTGAGIDSEPGGNPYAPIGVPSPRTCFVSAKSYLAGGTSGSMGKKYVIIVVGLP